MDWRHPIVSEAGLWIDAAGEVWRFHRRSEEPREVRHLGHVNPDVLARMRANMRDVGTQPLVKLGTLCYDCYGPTIRAYRPAGGERLTIATSGDDASFDPSPGGQALRLWMLALWRDLH